MLLRIIMIILFTFSNLLAIHDMLLRPKTPDSTQLLTRTTQGTTSTSTHFVIYYNEGQEYIANEILDIAEYVWSMEVDRFGFHPPVPSFTLIDIYLANSGVYNKETLEPITIPSYMSGYASYYSDGTPFFVINPDTSLDILKVTIAHEFFHTIQFSYGFSQVDDRLWYENLWFLEASATLMEDLVFDDINDYINFLSYYLPYTYLPLEYTNGGIEYGKAIFLRFLLKELGGIEWLTSFFEHYHYNSSAIENLKMEVENFNTLLLDYGRCLATLSSCFPEEPINETIPSHLLEENITVGTYGILLLQPPSNYIVAPNPSYLQSDLEGNRQKIVDEEKIVLVNPNKKALETGLLYSNRLDSIPLRQGWNLVSNICKSPLQLSSIDAKIIWLYRNGVYRAYSSDPNIYSLLEQEGWLIEDTTWRTKEALWIYASTPSTIPLKGCVPISYDLPLDNDWHLLTPAASLFYAHDLPSHLLVWSYNNGTWFVWKNGETFEELGVKKLEILYPTYGFFIKGSP